MENSNPKFEKLEIIKCGSYRIYRKVGFDLRKKRNAWIYRWQVYESGYARSERYELHLLAYWPFPYG